VGKSRKLPNIMTKRPSLFTPKSAAAVAAALPEDAAEPPVKTGTGKQPSRVGKRVLTIYLDPLAWKQLRQLALDEGTTTQALGEEAVNLLFTKHGINRSA
jgi:hypothetical protein